MTYTTTLKHFSIDPNRHLLVVPLKCYQMGLSSLMEDIRRKDPSIFVEDGIYLPSWRKFAADPMKAQGFWVGMLKAMFLGQGNHPELSVGTQTGKLGTVTMVFLPSTMKCRKAGGPLFVAAKIARATLPNTIVLVLANKNGYSNKNAEKKVKEQVFLARLQGKNVLILATCLAQRSFSVGEIDLVLLAYDGGQVGSTGQKVSRGLTPKDVRKVGRIISLSFDPTRDDKLDALVLDTARNIKKRHNLSDIKVAVSMVLRTVDIFDCQPDGPIKITESKYLADVVTKERIAYVMGKMAQIHLVRGEVTNAILNNTLERHQPQSDEKAPMGKTNQKGSPKTGGKRGKPLAKDQTAKIKEKLIAIIENLDVIIYSTNKTNMRDAFDVLRSNKVLSDSVNEVFGMSWKVIEELINDGAINLDFIELTLHKDIKVV